METLSWVGAGLLALIAVLHSSLGEREVLRPLFAQPGWSLPQMTRKQAEALLRFAWHLTTLAWWGLAVAALGLDHWLALAAVSLGSGFAIFVMLREHLAWPLFVISGLCALKVAGALPGTAVAGLGYVSAAVAAGAAGVHLYWASGGNKGKASAVPHRSDGTPMFRPGPFACAVACMVLCLFTALVVASLWIVEPPRVATWGLYCAVALLSLRVLGDGRFVGFTKTVRETAFGRADDRLYTPLAFTLWLGAVAALTG